MHKRFGTGLLTFSLVLSMGGPPAVAGLFDNIKEKAEEAAESLDSKLNNTNETPTNTNSNASTDAGDPAPAATASDAAAHSAAFASPADAYGQWQGNLTDNATNHILATAGFELLLSDAVNVARVSQFARRCLADLAETDTLGHYRATFLNGRETCGKNADIAIAPDGAFRVTWTDAPEIAGKTFEGLLERKYSAQERDRWSSSLDERKANDIVGFYPGMTYAEAVAHWQNAHSDLKREMRWVRDDGTSAIVLILTPKERAKAGQSQLNEQISLGFEAQTPEELPEVENPGPSANAEDLRRADARLMYVHRKVLFADRKGPTPETLKGALAKKYGAPSVDKQMALYEMQWSYDKTGKRIADAEGGACDHWQRYSNAELAPNYKRAQTAQVPYVTVHPDCGLTVKLRYSLFDGAVREMDTVVYDQQRLMGDHWYGLEKFHGALVAEARAQAEEMEAQDAPDL